MPPIDLSHRTSDVQPCPGQVEVRPGQAWELAVTKGSEDSQEHHGPVAMLDDRSEAKDLVKREHRPFGRPVDARSLDRHGLRTITSSSTAVAKMDRTNRYAFDVVL